MVFGMARTFAVELSKSLDVIEREGLLRNTEEVGNHMQRRMADWPKKHKLVGDVRGIGMLAGIELVADRGTKAPFPRAMKVAESLVDRAMARGLVRREADPEDKRARAVAVTARGRTLANRAIGAVEACDDAFFAGLGADREALTRALRSLAP